jgi:endoglucanase
MNLSSMHHVLFGYWSGFATRRAMKLLCTAALVSAAAACGSSSPVEVSSPASSASPSLLDAYPPLPVGPAPGASAEARAAFQALKRGINFGNMLESPNEGEWGLSVEDRYIALVGNGGFTSSVRLPVRWSNHATPDAAATIDPKFFERVDSVVDRLLARGVTVVLNMHHYRQLDGDTLDPNERAVPTNLVDVRMLAMWKQIAQRYANRSANLIFEIYNEPHGRLESRWNDLASRAIRLIRQSNAKRILVIGPTQYNSASKLPELLIPPDPHLILTVHHYDPFDFTHQGAEWVVPAKQTGVECCSDAQKRDMLRSLDLAASESKRLNYPIFVGEFGAYSKAPEQARVSYSRFMRDAMEERALPWFYWELASGFGIYDPTTSKFREPLFNALYGQ